MALCFSSAEFFCRRLAFVATPGGLCFCWSAGGELFDNEASVASVGMSN